MMNKNKKDPSGSFLCYNSHNLIILEFSMQNNIHLQKIAKDVLEQAFQKHKETLQNSTSAEEIYNVEFNLRSDILEIIKITDFTQFTEFYKDFLVAAEERATSLKQESNLVLNVSQFCISVVWNAAFNALSESDFMKEHAQTINDYRTALYKKQEFERLSNITLNGENLKAVDFCDVLWSGWECDAHVWVVNIDNKNQLVTSNHGEMQITEKAFLEGKIKEYEEAIANSKRLLQLLD